MRRRLIPFILLCLPLAASAADLARVVEQDFAPISGRVIAVRPDEVLINLDAAAGVRTGDLFAVVRTGPAITDPSSGAVLGAEETVVGILRVTQLANGFSKAAPVGHADAIREQDVVRRYAHLQVHFWDYTDAGERLFAQLRDALPTLRWVDYAVAQSWRPEEPTYAADGSSLYLLFWEGVLEIRDGEGRLIRAYDVGTEGAGQARFVTSAEPTTPAPAVAQAPAAAPPSPSPAPVMLAPGAGAAPWDGAGRTTAGLQTEQVGELSHPALIGDFLRLREADLVAATDGKSAWVSRLGHEMAVLASWTPTVPAKLLTIRWWRPSEGDPVYLVLNSWYNNSVRGEILRLDDGALTEVDTVQSALLGTFDRDGDGMPETLLSQSSAPDLFFGRRVDRRYFAGAELRSERWNQQLPHIFAVTGSAWIDVFQDGDPELAVVSDGILFVYDGEELVYKSARSMGGSASILGYNATPGVKDFLWETVRFELSPIARDIDGDGAPELLVACAKGLSRFLPGAVTDIEESWVAVVRHDQGRFLTEPLTPTFEQPIQALGLLPSGLFFMTKDELPRGDEAGRAVVYRLPIYPR